MTNTIIQYNSDRIKQYTNKELILVITELKGKHSLQWFSRYIKKNYNDIYLEVKFRTSFLDNLYQGRYDSLSARLYCIENNISSLPICNNPKCNNPVGWYPTTNSFRKYCCARCSASCEDTQQLRKKTMKERHGVEHAFQSPSLYGKAKNTWLINLGVEHPMQSSKVRNKFQNTMLQKHGVEHALQSDKFIDKVKLTNTTSFGYQWYTQSEQYHMNKRHKYHSEKYPGLTFDSNWEVIVYEFCKDNNIDIEYSPSITYKYEYDGRTWTYHPDFIINGKVYEVKGDQFFRINESGNDEMYCPYRHDDWSDEHYNWICGKYEAKHQCMLKNDVIIIRQKDLNDLTTYFD